MKKILLILAGFAMVSSLFYNCAGSGEQDKTITISGAFALYPMAVVWAEEYQKINPDVRIDISAGGAGKGMTDALNELADLGMFSKEVSKEEEEKGAWKIALTKDAVLPTISVDNPYYDELMQKGMTKQEFIDVFLNEKITSWGYLIDSTKNDEKINVYNRSDACGAAEMWAKFMGNKKQEDLKGIGVFGDPGMADAIKKDKNAIGFNNVAYVFDVKTRKKYDGIDVIPIDLNENDTIDAEEMVYNTLDDIVKAIKSGAYPSPPARDLYFVSKGLPKKQAVIDFIKWILTDGQKFVGEAGYVTLPEEQLKAELKKLE